MNTIARLVNANIKKCVGFSVNKQIRFISTSKKNRETASVVNPTEETVCKTEEKTKNWISYGFSHTDEKEDRLIMHTIMFLGISLVFVFGGFLLAYRPADLGRDWAHREGFLELRRREQEGLPLVDPNYLPLDQLILPTDEELGDTEIII
uniref:NADH dehydrogenase [ubiquinone] 1 beta subcomplex subunit 11, mitochondrial n=1 Tax=Rhodnius prolixus TaxID=13249 RepID=T1I5A7_RHOPR